MCCDIGVQGGVKLVCVEWVRSYFTNQRKVWCSAAFGQFICDICRHNFGKHEKRINIKCVVV